MELEKVVRKISAYCKDKYKGNHRFAFFHDANNELQIVCIVDIEDPYGIGSTKCKFISFNTKREKTGFINVEYSMKNVYLAEVYTMTGERGKGIAKELNYILEFYLKSMDKDYIYGIYSPQQMSDDVKKHIEVDEKELESRARHFYESTGFTVMDYNQCDISKDDEMIIDFNDSYFEVYSLFMATDSGSIVYKDLRDVDIVCKYHQDGDFLIQDGLDDEDVKVFVEKEKKKENKLRDLLLSFGWCEGKVERFIVLNKNYNLLDNMSCKNKNLPKDIIIKLKEISFNKNIEEVYTSLYEIYVSLCDRGIVIKR